MKKLVFILTLLVCCFNLNATNAVYTVTSRTSLEVDNIPENSDYEFEQTGSQKFRMTAGTSSIIRLTGYQNSQIQAVSLSMKSNQSSGSGSLTMTIDDKVVWQIENQSFSDNGWNGQYSTEYVPITKMLFTEETPMGDKVEIIINCYENSIYLNKIEIVYTGGENDNTQSGNDEKDTNNDNTDTTNDNVCIVNFYTQIDSEPDWYAEVKKGGSVQCPSFSYDDGYWTFIGWSAQLYAEISNTLPPIYQPDNIIENIKEDMSYYAIYEHKPQIEKKDSLTNGEYILTLNTDTRNFLLCNQSNTLLLNEINFDSFYYSDIFKITVEIISDSTFYLLYDDKYIIPDSNGKNLKTGISKYAWNYIKIGDCQYHIYTFYLNKKFYIGFNNYKPYLYGEESFISTLYWQFYSIPYDINLRYYYSYPKGKPSAAENVAEVLPFTISDNHIENPVRVCIRIYDINGRLVSVSTDESVDISTFPTGIYLVGFENHQYIKFLKR